MIRIDLLAISGPSCSGKDSLYKCLESILYDNGLKSTRIAFADLLKYEINDFCKKEYGISSFTSDPYEKSLIRDFMVFHGTIKRTQTNGIYWWKQTLDLVNNSLKNNEFPIITDFRHAEYPQDELFFIKNIFYGKILSIDRILKDGSFLKPYNKKEEDNIKIIKKNSDYNFSWINIENEKDRKDFVSLQLKNLIDEILKR